jgi:hypothetical protein
VKEGGRLFGKEAAERITDAVRWQESFPQSRKPHRSTPAAPGAQVLVARITSGTPDANGLYPAVITQRQPDGTYNDFAVVNVAPLNGETLSSGKRYAVVAADPAYAGAPAYQTLGGAASGGTAFSGAYYVAGNQSIPTGTGGTLINGFSASYDTDSYGPGLLGGTTDHLTMPFSGFYHVSLLVTWDVNNTGSRLCWCHINTGGAVGADSRSAISTSIWLSQGFSFSISLNAGQQISCLVAQDSGGNLAISPGGTIFGTALCIERIG